jgi:short-subunit dehydrogenase
VAETCLIVGAGPGIGQACASAFAVEGYDIALAARKPERVQAIAQDVQAKTGRTARAYTADAGDEASLRQLVADVRAAQGDPSVLIFNAAIAQMGRPTTLSAARVADEFRANVLGALVLAQELSPAMKAAGRGTILLTGGSFAIEPSADYASLSMSKAALRSLAHSLAQELGGFGIHVATVTVYGLVPRNTPFDPARIARSFLDLHRQPKGHFDIEAVYR